MITEESLKKPFYTPEEVAKMLKVGYYNIYNRVRYGEIEAQQIGRKWIITADAIMAYLNRRSNKK